MRQRQVLDKENEFRTDILDSQKDLLNMQEFYVNAGGNFWIAWDDSTQKIAGFVGLKTTDKHEGQLKRMSVLPEYRGQKIGLRLAKELITWAEKNNFEKIKLSTGKDEKALELIYLKVGFKIVGFDEKHEDHLLELKLKSN